MPAEQGRVARFTETMGRVGTGAYQNISGAYQWARGGGVGGAIGYLRQTQSGRAFVKGAGEVFGFTYRGDTPEGFLGWKSSIPGRAYRKGYGSHILSRGLSPGGKVPLAVQAGARARGLGTMAGVMKRQGWGGVKGLVGHTAGKAIFPIFTAMSMYAGYQTGGVLGAAQAGAKEALIWGGMRAVFATVPGAAGFAAPLLAAGALGYGAYAMGEAAQEHRKRLRDVEMGAPIVDPFGTTATLRQRSLSALQNTHINGRMAIGNEGILMADNAYRR